MRNLAQRNGLRHLKIQVGLGHARKTAEVSVEAGTYQITVEPGITITAPRSTSRDIRRHKASNYG
jgi:hypothetical protein